MMKQSFNNFSRHKQISLLSEMVRTDFKLRYQSSALGYIWSLLKPLFLFIILYTVFTKFLKIGQGIPNYALSLLLGIILWSFFVDATTGALKSVVAKGNLLRKIYMPRYLIPIASVASAFINMLLNLTVVGLFLVFVGTDALSWSTLILFPLQLIELAIVSIGVGFFLGAAYVKFRDIEHIWDVIRQALFYIIPIIYPLSRIPSEIFQKVIILNPLAQIIQGARDQVTYSGTPTVGDIFQNQAMILIPIFITITTLIIGFWYFMKKAPYFAEEV